MHKTLYKRMRQLMCICVILFGMCLVSCAYAVEISAYTDEQKQSAKAWLSSHGYSPTKEGAYSALSDYREGRLNLSASEREAAKAAGIEVYSDNEESDSTDKKTEKPEKDKKKNKAKKDRKKKSKKKKKKENSTDKSINNNTDNKADDNTDSNTDSNTESYADDNKENNNKIKENADKNNSGINEVDTSPDVSNMEKANPDSTNMTNEMNNETKPVDEKKNMVAYIVFFCILGAGIMGIVLKKHN